MVLAKSKNGPNKQCANDAHAGHTEEKHHVGHRLDALDALEVSNSKSRITQVASGEENQCINGDDVVHHRFQRICCFLAANHADDREAQAQHH